jgi:hypothetical protein
LLLGEFDKTKNLSKKREVSSQKEGLLLSYLSKQLLVLQDLAPIPNGTVAGRHRASPSATLDKRTYIFYSFKVLNLI